MKLNHKFALLLAGAVLAGSLTGCGASGTPASSAASSEAAASSAVSEAASEPAAEAALPDGVYTADFDTDSSMFHANEANDGKGTLTVKDGQMTFHVSLVSKKIVNLYVGMAADAEAHEGDWLQPTTDTVTYSDGLSDEVYGFDIPVKALDEDFQLAILGSKGKWYDHTVRVANAQPAAAEAPADGTYTCDVTLEGGSGRATVDSPAALYDFHISGCHSHLRVLLASDTPQKYCPSGTALSADDRMDSVSPTTHALSAAGVSHLLAGNAVLLRDTGSAALPAQSGLRHCCHGFPHQLRRCCGDLRWRFGVFFRCSQHTGLGHCRCFPTSCRI